MAASRLASPSCCEFIFCSSGSRSPIRAEDALYESPVLRRFAGVDLGRAAAPDETTILRFRRLLEEHELCGPILDAVNHYLAVMDCVSRPARSWMRRSSTHRARPEQQEGARPGDASDTQRQSVVFRRQGAYRRGFESGYRAFRVHLGSECF